MSQCQDSGGLRACSGLDRASLLLPLPFSAHSPIVSLQGKLPKREAWRGCWTATPPPPHPESVGASHRSAHEGSGAPEEEGMGKGGGVTTGKLGCREEAWVLSLLPRGTRGEAVLGVCSCFHREGRQDEMGEGSETEWCFS